MEKARLTRPPAKLSKVTFGSRRLLWPRGLLALGEGYGHAGGQREATEYREACLERARQIGQVSASAEDRQRRPCLIAICLPCMFYRVFEGWTCQLPLSPGN